MSPEAEFLVANLPKNMNISKFIPEILAFTWV